MRQNPHVRICGGPGSATTLVYPTTDGDQASRFLEHDLRQLIGRLRGCPGRDAFRAAARIAGLACGEAMRLGRVPVADGRVASRASAAPPADAAHGATAWPPASAGSPVARRAASSWA